MSNFLILFKKDLLELKRTKKWLIFLLTFVGITILSVVTARLLPELLNLVLEATETGLIYPISIADSYMQFVSNIGEIAFLLIVIMFSNVLVKEKVKGTYYTLKGNKVEEKEIVLSQFVTKLILITASYLASVVLFVVLNLIVYKEYTGIRGVVALSYLYLDLIFALCLALFISSVVNKNSKGYIFAIGIYFILSLLSIFPYIDIYNPLYGLTIANNHILGVKTDLSDYLVNLFSTITISIGLVIASIYLFKNRIDNRK